MLQREFLSEQDYTVKFNRSTQHKMKNAVSKLANV